MDGVQAGGLLVRISVAFEVPWGAPQGIQKVTFYEGVNEEPQEQKKHLFDTVYWSIQRRIIKGSCFQMSMKPRAGLSAPTSKACSAQTTVSAFKEALQYLIMTNTDGAKHRLDQAQRRFCKILFGRIRLTLSL